MCPNHGFISILTLRKRFKILKKIYTAAKPRSELKAGLEVYVNRNPQLSNEECTSWLKEDLSADLIYWDEIMRGPGSLYRIVGNYLPLIVSQYTPHLDTQIIMRGLAYCFFSDGDSEYALQRWFALKNNTSDTIRPNQRSV